MVDVAYGNDFRPVASHTVAATLNKTWGEHSLKSGAEMRIYGERSTPIGNDQSGRYQFTNTYTRQNSSSGTDYQGLQAYAAFLLGMPSTMTWQKSPKYNEHSTTWGFFVQDDWRLTNKLTLNLGLRYEVEQAAGREGQPERLRLRLRIRPADPGAGPGQLREPERSGPEGHRAADLHEGRPPVRGQGRRTRPLPHAEEHVPSAFRDRLPADAEDGRPRRRRAVRRVPRRAARRRDHDRLLADHDDRHLYPAQRGADGADLGLGVPHDAAHRAGRQRERQADLPRQRDLRSSTRTRRSRSSSATRSASSRS